MFSDESSPPNAALALARHALEAENRIPNGHTLGLDLGEEYVPVSRVHFEEAGPLLLITVNSGTVNTRVHVRALATLSLKFVTIPCP